MKAILMDRSSRFAANGARLAALAVGVFLLASPAQADPAEAEEPQATPVATRNSTWIFDNTSARALRLQCTGERHGVWIQQRTLAPRQTYSETVNVWWGDGLGFPEPSTSFTCRFESGDRRAVDVALTSLDWGDTVSFLITDRKITAFQQSNWNPALARTTVFDRP
jgi:hypothetical protein